MKTGIISMTRQQAIEYFFARIRGQILTALANRKMCEDLHLIGKLALFEKDRKEGVGNDGFPIKSMPLQFIPAILNFGLCG